MPRAEYERLKALSDEAAEDIGTARLVARAKKDDDLRLPITVVEQLASGENPIRVLRDYREMTQQELAVSVQIKQGYLSDIETGRRKGPFELHRKIAASLGVPFDLLAPIAVSMQKAAPERGAAQKKAVAAIRKSRGQV